VNMTMRYTHIGLNDQAKAVANLPSPKQNSDSLPAKLDGCIKQAVTAALQMRCISCSAESQPESDSDSKEDDQKRHNPCQGKGYVDLCRRSSDTDKTRVTGLEPAASNVTGWRSNQLSYTPNNRDSRQAFSWKTKQAGSNRES
jgi:hypothetical protein